MYGYGYRRGLSGLLLWSVIKLVFRLVGRFCFGLPMDGKRRTDATFFAHGTGRVGQLPDWFGQHDPSKWSLLPGWQRAMVRLGTCGVLYEAWRHPQAAVFVGINVAAAALGVAAWRVWVWQRDRYHNREIVGPLWATLAPYLDMAPTDDPAMALEVPKDFGTNRAAVVAIHYPVGWDADSTRQKHIGELMGRHIGADWDVTWGRLEATWRRLPTPPDLVPWADLHPERYPLAKVPMGVDARGRSVVFDMEQESPHVLFTAPTGHGKSSTLRLPATHTRVNGGLVDIIDFKLMSFTRSLEGLSGVRVHTNIESAVWALSEYYVSMTAAYEAIKAGLLDPADVSPRLLLIDEFDSLMSMVADWWAAYCAARKMRAGQPPFLQAWKFVLWQGRQAEHRMVVGVHTPEAKLFNPRGSGTAIKNNFGSRLLLGQVSDTKWRQTFDSEPRVPFDQTHNGRGVVNLGKGAEELQVGWLSEEESRARGAAAPEAPDWFDSGSMPPWVTPQVLERVASELRITWLSLDGTAPRDGTSLPARMRGDVPRADPPAAETAGAWLAAPYTARLTAIGALPAGDATGYPDLDSAVAGARSAAHSETPIAGEPAAVAYLQANGYPRVTRASFHKARQRARKTGGEIARGWRHPDTGQPCWLPSELLAWQRGRPIAGQAA